MRVHYKESGMTQIREVPQNTSPEAYKWGILVGPPDLSNLSLSVKKVKELTEALAQAFIGDYADTQSRRGEILDIVAKVTGRRDKALLKEILYIYQENFLSREDSGS